MKKPTSTVSCTCHPQLDKTKKYPIISNVYPGPQDDQIPQSFTLDDNGNQSLAEMKMFSDELKILEKDLAADRKSVV